MDFIPIYIQRWIWERIGYVSPLGTRIIPHKRKWAHISTNVEWVMLAMSQILWAPMHVLCIITMFICFLKNDHTTLIGLWVLSHTCIWHNGHFHTKGSSYQLQVCVWTYNVSNRDICLLMYVYGYFVSFFLFGPTIMTDSQSLRY